jgi:hypothetical protein
VEKEKPLPVIPVRPPTIAQPQAPAADGLQAKPGPEPRPEVIPGPEPRSEPEPEEKAGLEPETQAKPPPAPEPEFKPTPEHVTEPEKPLPEKAEAAEQQSGPAKDVEAVEEPAAAAVDRTDSGQDGRQSPDARAPQIESEQEATPEQPQVPRIPGPPPGYFFPPPNWYPMPVMPPAFGYPPQYPPQGPYQGMGLPGQSTELAGASPMSGPPAGQMILGPPPAGPQAPPGLEQAPYPQDLYEPPMVSLEGEEFGELIVPEPSHWRADLKWLFGVLTTLVLFSTLLVAGFYRVTGSGIAKQILVPVIGDATQVSQKVDKNYQDLRSKARKRPGSTITIPGTGGAVSIAAADINSMSSEDLKNAVNLEVARQIYSNGYR